jgi:hypothetical protein
MSSIIKLIDKFSVLWDFSLRSGSYGKVYPVNPIKKDMDLDFASVTTSQPNTITDNNENEVQIRQNEPYFSFVNNSWSLLVQDGSGNEVKLENIQEYIGQEFGTVFIETNFVESQTLFLEGLQQVLQGKNKLAIAYTPTKLVFSLNGSILQTTQGVYDFDLMDFLNIGNYNNIDQYNDFIIRIGISKYLFSNSELNILTAN